MTEDGIMILVINGHAQKTKSPMYVTEDGIMILANDEHSQKAYSSMFVTDDGIVTLSSDEHLKKAWCPIDVTEDGILISINFWQNMKQRSSIKRFGCDTKKSTINLLFLWAAKLIAEI